MIGLPNIDMHEVTRLTREGRLQDALDLLQGRKRTEPNVGIRTAGGGPGRAPENVIDLSPPTEPGGAWGQRDTTGGSGERPRPIRTKRGLGDTIREKLRRFDPKTPKIEVPVPAGAQFEARSFSCGQGARDYRLYFPSRHEPGCPLVVMLHGCTQSPEDFAVGTGMNALAERDGFIVVYPGQTATANPSKCWNWFRPEDQRRDMGEPAILAGLTRAVAQEFGIDPDRIYIAGLSAGGAAAVIMGQTYPDLYAAIGVHSGLPYRAASDVPSALAAMRGDARKSPDQGGTRLVPTIVFHGDLDRTVHPSNADRIVDSLRAKHALTDTTEREPCGEPPVRRSLLRNADGHTMIEYWRVAGAGHAWSGGNAGGSFVEPDGPRASEEMLRFFNQQRMCRTPR
jgi:poly(hydroxyalkanoate) depolymerase family esterase